MDRHFIGQQKPRTEPGGLRAEGEHGCDSSRVANSTGRNDRDGRHRVDYRRHQRKRRHTTPDVTAGLPTLRNDDVRSRSDCASGFLGAADRMHDKPVGVVHQVDVAAGIAEDEGHDPQAGGKGLIDSTVLIGGENEVAGKRPVGEACRCTNHIFGVVGPRQSQAAEAAGI